MQQFDKKFLKNLAKEFSSSKGLPPIFQEERIQSFITIILTLATCSVFGLFAINPTISTIVNLRKQLEDDQLVDKKLAEKIANISILQGQYEVLQVDLPVVFSAIPSSHQIPQFIGQLRAIAQQNNVHIKTLQTFPVTLSLSVASTENSFTFSLEGDGEQDAISHFITSLASFERVITLDSISINKSNEQNTSTAFVDINGKAYFKSL